MDRAVIDIIIRYVVLVLLGLGNLVVFHVVFTPLTVSLVYILLSIFTDVVVIDSIGLLVHGVRFEVVSACVAGAAYYLLTILVLSVSDVDWVQRLHMLLVGYISLFIVNSLRIVFMVYLFGSVYFDSVHLLLWRVVSLVVVVLIWFGLVRFYKVKSIPIWSDVKELVDNT